MHDRPMIRVDLHVHSNYSRDGVSTPEAIVEASRRVGMDRIALTDHGTIQGALALQRIAPQLVIVGQEIKTTVGELIAYFVQEEIPAGLEPKEAIRRLRDQGAIVGIPHPLDRLRGEALGYRAVMEIIDQIDCIEAFNSRVLLPADNHRAAALARQHGLPVTAGSDAHMASRIGRAFVEMPAFSGRDDFVASLCHGRVRGTLSGPLVHFVSTYAKLRHRATR